MYLLNARLVVQCLRWILATKRSKSFTPNYLHQPFHEKFKPELFMEGGAWSHHHHVSSEICGSLWPWWGLLHGCWGSWQRHDGLDRALVYNVVNEILCIMYENRSLRKWEEKKEHTKNLKTFLVCRALQADELLVWVRPYHDHAAALSRWSGPESIVDSPQGGPHYQKYLPACA